MAATATASASRFAVTSLMNPRTRIVAPQTRLHFARIGYLAQSIIVTIDREEDRADKENLGNKLTQIMDELPRK